MTIAQYDIERAALAQNNTTAPVEVALSNASNASSALSAGLYIITSNVDCTFLQGSAPTALTTSRKLWANTYRYLSVQDTSNKVAGIVATGTGTLSIEKI